MTKSENPDRSNELSRRKFLGAASLTTFTALAPSVSEAEAGSNCTQVQTATVTGNGEWTYRVVAGWGALPAGATFGGTHGGIAQDKTGHMYISTQSETGVLVYNPDGVLIKTIASQYPEVHSIVYAQEEDGEYLYTTVQKGTPRENWLFVKMKTDGTVAMKITAPLEAGFKAPNEWRLTAAVPGPDGSIFIANGYGDSRIFRFNSKGEYQASYAGKGDSDGLFNCSHGLAVDTRYDQPLLLVCDRENRRLCHFDFDGKFVRTVSQHMRRPCQVSFHGDCALVSELEGRVTILDRDNTAVAFLGDNPHKAQWANYQLSPPEIAATSFSAAHGCYIDGQANIYVSDWNHAGRVTKLEKLRA